MKFSKQGDIYVVSGDKGAVTLKHRAGNEYFVTWHKRTDDEFSYANCRFVDGENCLPDMTTVYLDDLDGVEDFLSEEYMAAFEEDNGN